MKPAPLPTLSHADLLAMADARADAAERLAARAGYATDHPVPDALHARILGSPHPHARIVAIDVARAAAIPGVRAVVTAADIPGERRYGLRVVDRPVLCDDKVRCIGDPVAAVAADTAEQAAAALAAIDVRWQLLPTVTDPLSALAPDAEPVHAGGNLLSTTSLTRGDPTLIDAPAAHVIDATYETARQMHAYLETEGGVVQWHDDGTMTVRFGCQHPERDRQFIAAMLTMPAAAVRVIGSPVGGSYGGKDELTIQPIAALLAWKARRSVRLRLSRGESTDLGVKRHPFRIRMRSSCDAGGRLLSHQAWLLADTGAYATHGPEVLDAAHEHASGPYAWRAVQSSGRLAYTNNGIAGAFRGFGAVQAQFALERQIDRLAQAAGIDPLEFRRRNLLPPDAPGPLGQQVVPFDGPRDTLDALAGHRLRQMPRSDDGRWLSATGLACIHRSDSFGRGGPNDSCIELALAADGRIEVRTGFTEMGQGLVPAIRAMTARALGCAEDDVRPVLGDTALTPDSGSTAASRTTTILHRALGAAADPWCEAMRRAAATLCGQPADALRFASGGFASVDTRGPAARRAPALLLGYDALAGALGDARPVLRITLPGEVTPSAIPGAHWVFGAASALARVAVDRFTGRVRVEDLAIAGALGPVISPMALLGQFEGGAMMGVGLATTESLDCVDGRYTARNLDGYLVPTFADAPRIEFIAVQALHPDDTAGPRGAGEIAVCIAAAAVANGIAAATGHATTRLPMRPADLIQPLPAPAATP